MNKKFNPRIKKVKSIGDELRFQREYYCFKNNTSLPLKINNKKLSNVETLQEVLYNFMLRNIGDNSELATSYDVLYAIENGKSKKKKEKYNPNKYYLRMFFMFALYGFLDYITILDLLEKYEISPSYPSSVATFLELKDSYSIDSLLQRKETGKVIKINVKSKKIKLSEQGYKNIFGGDDIINDVKNNASKVMYVIEKEGNKKKIVEKPLEYQNIFLGYDWSYEQEKLRDDMKKLPIIDRYCLSLELGRDTSYINDFIDDNLQTVNIDTIMKTLEYFNMKNGLLYDILLKLKTDFSIDTLSGSNVEIL